MASLVPLFANVAEDEEARPQHRGLAATCFARAGPTSRMLDLETIETLLHSSDRVAVEGGLEALDHAVSLEPIDAAAFRDRLDSLSEDEAPDVDIAPAEQALAETLREALDTDPGLDDGDTTTGSTRVYAPGGSHDGPSVPSFCPSCGADLAAWRDVSFCPDCGRDLST